MFIFRITLLTLFCLNFSCVFGQKPTLYETIDEAVGLPNPIELNTLTKFAEQKSVFTRGWTILNDLKMSPEIKRGGVAELVNGEKETLKRNTKLYFKSGLFDARHINIIYYDVSEQAAIIMDDKDYYDLMYDKYANIGTILTHSEGSKLFKESSNHDIDLATPFLSTFTCAIDDGRGRDEFFNVDRAELILTDRFIKTDKYIITFYRLKVLEKDTTCESYVIDIRKLK